MAAAGAAKPVSVRLTIDAQTGPGEGRRRLVGFAVCVAPPYEYESKPPVVKALALKCMELGTKPPLPHNCKLDGVAIVIM